MGDIDNYGIWWQKAVILAFFYLNGEFGTFG
jgi:hypothetical protein